MYWINIFISYFHHVPQFCVRLMFLFLFIPNYIYETIIKCKKGGRRGGRNRMVVGFITTYASNAYHH